MFEQTKALCAQFLEMGIPGFDLIVYKDGECVLRHMGGFADRENKIPVKGDERYHIYSCSKLFTCTAAMQLWEKGLFSLEDELGDYLPAFREMTVKTAAGVKKTETPIRIHQLFKMTAGFNYDLQTPALQEYYRQGDGRCPTLELVNELAKAPLDFEPGERWQYSLCHDVLAALVEVLSGEKFEDYVKAHIFAPLGMKRSDFLHPLEDWNGFARQYRYDEATGNFEPWWENTYRPGPAYASGGAGCVSTAEDYIRFLEALRTGNVLKKETVALMATDRLTEQQRRAYSYGNENVGYGLGMRTPRPTGRDTEFGWGGAAGAFASVDPVNGLSIYYAQHVLSAPNRDLRREIYHAVRADLLGERFDLPKSTPIQDRSITY